MIPFREPFTFIQGGAHVGITPNDRLRKYILRGQATGLLVEPIAKHFTKLRSNYSHLPGLSFSQCALGAEDGQTVLYRLDHEQAERFPEDWAGQLASTDPTHVRKHFKGRWLEIVEEPALVSTIESLCAWHKIEEVDLLLLDIEGAELEALSGLGRLRPEYIIYEHKHCDSDAVMRLLGGLGYEWQASRDLDTMVKRA